MNEKYTVTVAAKSRMFCKRANVKTQLDIASSDTSEDSRIDALIIAASEQIRQLLGREPWLQTYLENRPGQGGTNLLLRHWPLKGDPASVTVGTGSSPSTVTASTYSVGGNGRRDRLFRTSLWPVASVLAGDPIYGSQQPGINVTYSGGWVMPDEILSWPTSEAVSADAWYESSNADEPFIFQVSTAGTTDSSEPTWPTVAEGTVTDNTAIFTAYQQRLPRPLEEAALMLTVGLFSGGMGRPAGIKSEAGDGFKIEYSGQADAVSGTVRSLVGMYA